MGSVIARLLPIIVLVVFAVGLVLWFRAANAIAVLAIDEGMVRRLRGGLSAAHKRDVQEAVHLSGVRDGRRPAPLRRPFRRRASPPRPKRSMPARPCAPSASSACSTSSRRTSAACRHGTNRRTGAVLFSNPHRLPAHPRWPHRPISHPRPARASENSSTPPPAPQAMTLSGISFWIALP